MAKNKVIYLITAFILAICSTQAFSYSELRRGRMGVGFTNQLMIDTPALSFRVLKSRKFGFQGIAALDTSDDGGYGVGIKAFNYIFDEPNLAFYTSLLGAIVNQKENGEDNSGYQVDFGLGTEFSIPQVESIGFSFEFGISVNKIEDDVTIQTNANHILTAGVHFYL